MDISNDCMGLANHWGTRTPMMAVEECGELIQAICHAERAFGNRPDIHDTYVANREQLIDAIGDVHIALEALKQYYRIPPFKIDMRIENKHRELIEDATKPIIQERKR